MHYSALLTSNRIFDEEFYDEIAKIKCREISPFKKREIIVAKICCNKVLVFIIYMDSKCLQTAVYIYIGNITEVEEKRLKGKDINFLE